jgi:hypothetical protein
MRDGRVELTGRITEIDDGRAPGTPATGAASDVDRFVTTMMWAEGQGATGDPHGSWIIDPDIADELAGSSAALRRMATQDAQLIAGPLASERQRWMTTDRSAAHSARLRAPHPSHFTSVDAYVRAGPSGKPFRLGLFSSTEGLDGLGTMWRRYVDFSPGMYRPPWHTWALRVRPGAVVYEVTGATDWARLIVDNPRDADGMLYPDWASIGRRYDAVHVTARAVVAIDGMHLHVPRGVVAPSWWTVESTLWLRWCFSGTSLVDVQKSAR